jgi:hypothetical protein
VSAEFDQPAIKPVRIIDQIKKRKSRHITQLEQERYPWIPGLFLGKDTVHPFKLAKMAPEPLNEGFSFPEGILGVFHLGTDLEEDFIPFDTQVIFYAGEHLKFIFAAHNVKKVFLPANLVSFNLVE